MATGVEAFSVQQAGGRWDTRCHLCPTGGMGYRTLVGAHRAIRAHYVAHHEADVLAGAWTADDLAVMRDRHALVGEG